MKLGGNGHPGAQLGHVARPAVGLPVDGGLGDDLPVDLAVEPPVVVTGELLEPLEAQRTEVLGSIDRNYQRAKDLLTLVCPRIARDRYRVDVLLDPSRFLSELPNGVRERVVVAAEEDADDLLPPGGRYQLPGFIDDFGDDDVN